jgi:hypothetical protein
MRPVARIGSWLQISLSHLIPLPLLRWYPDARAVARLIGVTHVARMSAAGLGDGESAAIYTQYVTRTLVVARAILGVKHHYLVVPDSSPNVIQRPPVVPIQSLLSLIEGKGVRGIGTIVVVHLTNATGRVPSFARLQIILVRCPDRHRAAQPDCVRPSCRATIKVRQRDNQDERVFCGLR